MQGVLSEAELKAICQWSTCAVANGIELFNIRPRNEGYMLSDVKCFYPDFKPMIGYAATAVICADSPGDRRINPPDWWETVLKLPSPRVVVIQDLDSPIKGSFWGEVNANIHRALGCVGTVTNGSVRDLEEVHELGFHFFANCISVSHAYVHLVDMNIAVKFGGLVIKPGDLVMGDRHGVISIPLKIAREVPRAAQLVEDWERPVINLCKSEIFSMDGLKERYMSPRPTWPPESS